jgi:uncharacterized protein YbaP (TraB family)
MISLKEQAQELVESVLDYSLAKSEISELVEAYKDEDLELIYQLVKDQFAEMNGYENVFLAQRNQRWLPEIVKNIKKRPCFIAVGAAHLVGTDGLLQLLTQNGYIVKPLF